MELKPLSLNDILNKSLKEKIGYIENDLSRIINKNQRGDYDNYRPLIEVHKRIFNHYDERPMGELSEVKSAVNHGKGRAIILGEFADVYYCAANLDSRLLLGKDSLSEKIFSAGKSAGFSKELIVDGCIIKYTSRANGRKAPSHELSALEDHLGMGGYRLSRMQKRRAIKAIAKIEILKEFYMSLIARTQETAGVTG